MSTLIEILSRKPDISPSRKAVSTKLQRQLEMDFRLMAIESFTDLLVQSLCPPFFPKKAWKKLDVEVLGGSCRDTSLPIVILYALGRPSVRRNVFLAAKFSAGYSHLEKLSTTLEGLAFLGLERALTPYNKNYPEVVQVKEI